MGRQSNLPQPHRTLKDREVGVCSAHDGRELACLELKEGSRKNSKQSHAWSVAPIGEAQVVRHGGLHCDVSVLNDHPLPLYLAPDFQHGELGESHMAFHQPSAGVLSPEVAPLGFRVTPIRSKSAAAS